MNKFITLKIFIIFLLVNLTAVSAQELYIIGKSNSKIYKADKNVAGTKSDLLSPPLPHGIAIDPDSGDIYYTDNTNTITSGRIIRVNRDGTNPTTIASTLNTPTGLALDHTNDRLYYVAQDGNSFPAIYTVDTSGSGSPTLVIVGDVTGGPVDVDIDITGGTLYWTDSRGPTIRRALTSGLSAETFVTGLGGTLSGISVDKQNRLVYWINQVTTQIQYASATASAPASALTAVTDSLIVNGGLSVDGSQSPTEFFTTTGTSNQVLKATFGGSASVLLQLADGIANPTDVEFFNVAVPTATPTTVPTTTATSTPVSLVLSPETQITAAPAVVVAGKKANLTLQNFTSAINTNAALQFVHYSEFEKLAAAGDLEVRYDVRVTAAKKKDNQKLLAKKNTLTVKNLKAGNYSVNYSAVAFSKKSKTQIQKAKSAGKTGFTATHKKVFSTNFSPSAAFTIQ